MLQKNRFLDFVCTDRIANPSTYGFANAEKTLEICLELIQDNYYGLDPEIKIELIDDYNRLNDEHLAWLKRFI